MTAEITVPKQRGRPFKPGQSGNLAGRPRGSRNKTTLAAEALLEGEAETLNSCLHRTSQGRRLDRAAYRHGGVVVMERICAPVRERAIHIDVPSVASASDLPIALDRIIGAVASGEISPSEGLTLSSIVLSAGRAFELGDFAGRLAEIERRLGDASDER